MKIEWWGGLGNGRRSVPGWWWTSGSCREWWKKLLLQKTEIEAQYDTGYNLEIKNNTYEARAGANIRNENNFIICIFNFPFIKCASLIFIKHSVFLDMRINSFKI